MGIERWNQVLHPSARFWPREPSPGNGALPYWQRAAAALVDLDALDFLSDDEELCELDRSRTPLAAEERAERIDVLLSANRLALAEFRAGIRAGAFQRDVTPFHLTNDGNLNQSLRYLVRLERFEASRQFDARNINEAGHSLVRIVEAGRLLMACEGLSIDYLSGSVIVGVGVCELDTLLNRGDLSRHSLITISDALDRVDFMGLLADTIRSDLAKWTLPILESLDSRAPDQRVEGYFELFDGPSVRSEYAWRTDQLREILSGHPSAWNADETARTLGLLAAGVIAECEDESGGGDELLNSGCASLRRHLDDFYRAFPLALYQPLLEFADPVQGECDRAVRDQVLAANLAVRPLSPRQLRSVREQLRGFDNPLGLAVVGQLCPATTPKSVAGFQSIKKTSELRRRVHDALG